MTGQIFTTDEVEFINNQFNHKENMISKFEILSNVFSIIPLYMNSDQPERMKSPVEKEWSKYCTEKRTFNRINFIDHNAGIACGIASGVIVIDIDDHKQFDIWCTENKILKSELETYTVKTGGKSLHLYYKYPTDGQTYGCRSIKSNDNTTIFDIKGHGGQVVAPGSIHQSGKSYTILRNIPILDAPMQFLNLAKKNYNTHKSTSVNIENSICIYDLRKVDIDILNIPEGQKQKIKNYHALGSRSEAEMSVLCSLVRAKLNYNDILSIFEDTRYGIGAKHREMGSNRFNRMNKQIESAKEFIGQEVVNSHQYTTTAIGEIYDCNPQLNFIIDGLWVENDTLMLFGKGGTGKSLFALNLVIALANPPVNGFLNKFKIAKPCKTLILQSEVSIAGMNDRLHKIFENRPIPQNVRNNIKFCSIENNIMTSGNFDEDEYFNEISLLILSEKPDIIMIDPLISFHNEDENANKPMRKVLDRIKFLGQKTNTAILVIHHSGKSIQGNAESGGRGASSIGDWASSSIELKRKGSGDEDLYELIHKKARDFKEFGTIHLSRKSNLTFEIYDKACNDINTKDQLVINAINFIGDNKTTQKELANTIQQISKNSNIDLSHNTAINYIQSSIKRNIISLDNGKKKYIII